MPKNDVIDESANFEKMQPKKLNKVQIAKLDKDQQAGRKPIIIRGVQGYLDGDGNWKSVALINRMKKEGVWGKQPNEVSESQKRRIFK